MAEPNRIEAMPEEGGVTSVAKAGLHANYSQCMLHDTWHVSRPAFYLTPPGIASGRMQGYVKLSTDIDTSSDLISTSMPVILNGESAYLGFFFFFF